MSKTIRFNKDYGYVRESNSLGRMEETAAKYNPLANIFKKKDALKVFNVQGSSSKAKKVMLDLVHNIEE